MIINGQALLEAAPIKNMLTTKERYKGVSHGLAEAGYDIRLKQSVTFVPAESYFYVPQFEVDGRVSFTRDYFRKANVIITDTDEKTCNTSTGRFIIASAIEEFQMPTNLLGLVKDKSTWARKGLSVFNTVIEPGWKGFLTLELVYHGQGSLSIPAGSGIAQVIFEQTAETAAYSGKYNNQVDRPVDAIFESPEAEV